MTETLNTRLIMIRVTAEFGVSVNDLLSPRRARAVARPRQVAMWLCKELTKMSFPRIGRSFGGRDHTTVMHAVKRINQLMGDDPLLRRRVDSLKTGLEKFMPGQEDIVLEVPRRVILTPMAGSNIAAYQKKFWTNVKESIV